MLVLERGEGQWVDITHKSGDVLRIRTDRIGRDRRSVCLGFEDAARNFEIRRPERRQESNPPDASPPTPS